MPKPFLEYPCFRNDETGNRVFRKITVTTTAPYKVTVSDRSEAKKKATDLESEEFDTLDEAKKRADHLFADFEDWGWSRLSALSVDHNA